MNIDTAKHMYLSFNQQFDIFNTKLTFHFCAGQNVCNGSKDIERVAICKYFGGVFDIRLKWIIHTHYINSKIRKCILIFKILH